MRPTRIGGILSIVIALATPRLAEACAGGDCNYEPPPLVAVLKSDKMCFGVYGEGVPFLNPYNDTRVNLALLFQEAKLLQLSLPAPTPKEPPPAGTLAASTDYPVPFHMEILRGINPGGAAPDNGTPAPTPEETELLELAKRLGVEEADTQGALGRVDASQTGRCASESSTTLLDFVKAVAQEASLAEAERTVLAGERLRMAGLCEGMSDPPQPLAATTDAGKGFAAYLDAARHFYRGELDDAESGFAALAASPAPFVREAARYMIGRVRINEAQAGAFSDYGELKPAAIDKEKLALARGDFQVYLDAYPKGRYAQSARGLFRRIDWLAQETDAFPQDLATALASYDGHAPDADEMYALLDEIDAKYLAVGGLAPDSKIAWQVPELAATTVLTRMREVKSASPYEPVAAQTVQQHKAELSPAPLPLLFDFLVLARAYWVDHDAAKVIAATEGRKPSAAGNIEFSLLMLRGLALESAGRWPDANALWRALLGAADDPLRRNLLQLALALNDERSGKLAEVFAPDSLVRDPALHRPLLKYAASPALLNAVVLRADGGAEERSTALFTLLYKELVHGDARGFGETLARFPPEQFPDIDGLHSFAWEGQSGGGDYACPALADTVRRLATSPEDPESLNCLAEFFFRFEDQLSPGTKPPADELGGTPDGFSGKERSRLDFYLAVMANPKAKGDAEAYALYRAVNCFASSGNNHCGDQDVPKEERRRWFNRLKQTYRDNAWSKAQKYWW